MACASPTATRSSRLASGVFASAKGSGAWSIAFFRSALPESDAAIFVFLIFLLGLSMTSSVGIEYGRARFRSNGDCSPAWQAGAQRRQALARQSHSFVSAEATSPRVLQSRQANCGMPSYPGEAR